MTPPAFTFWRALLGAAGLLGLLAFLRLRGRPALPWHRLPARALMALVGATLASLVLNLAIFTAFQRTSIAVALLGFYTYPAIVALVAIVAGEERLDGARLAALALALTGMVIVVLGGTGGPAGPGFEALGFGLAVVAAAMQAIYIMLGRRGFRSIPSEEVAFAVLLGGTLGYLLVALASSDPGALWLPLRVPAAWPILAWGGLAGAALPVLLFMVGVRAIGPTRSAIVSLLEPVAGAALAAVLLHEALGPLQAAGGALVLVAAVLLQRGRAPGDQPADHEVAAVD